MPDQEYRPGSWGYVGGRKHDTTTEVKNTDDEPLYQTMQVEIEGYRFDVPDGRYEVELLFSDVFRPSEQSAYLLGRDANADMTAAGNCFTISANGRMLEEVFNPSMENDYFQAIRRRYIVDVEGGSLDISFNAIVGSTFLSGIKLRKL